MSFSEELLSFVEKAASLDVSIFDVLDIILMTVVLFFGIRLIRDSRAFRLAKGLLFLGLFYFVVYELDMRASTYMFRFIFQNVFILLVVIFQQEIRQVVEHLGNSSLSISKFLRIGVDDGRNEVVIDAIIEICKAVGIMSESKIGALIVMERNDILNEVMRTGIPVDAKVSHELIGNIFFPNSPLHDGAAIIRNGRVHSAGCVLPLTASENVPSDLGTRHRAAMGMSENSDAVVIVVSEETGIISVARGGQLKRNYTETDLRAGLMDLFGPPEEDSGKNSSIFKRLKKGMKKNEEEKQDN